MKDIMEKLGFTPGPWEVFENKVRGKKHIIISRIVKGKRYTDICESTFPWRKQDLNLIATAPELLEFLIGFCVNVEANEHNTHPIILRVWYSHAIKTIENATGKTWEEIKTLYQKR